MIVGNYRENGIIADKAKHGIKVTYNGLLAQSGADNVYACYGYGDKWANQTFYKMNRTSHGFETTLPVDEKVVNVAFKDSANNWDNNSGRNYSFLADDVKHSVFSFKD